MVVGGEVAPASLPPSKTYLRSAHTTPQAPSATHSYGRILCESSYRSVKSVIPSAFRPNALAEGAWCGTSPPHLRRPQRRIASGMGMLYFNRHCSERFGSHAFQYQSTYGPRPGILDQSELNWIFHSHEVEALSRVERGRTSSYPLRFLFDFPPLRAFSSLVIVH
jgi:hypothetical protein